MTYKVNQQKGQRPTLIRPRCATQRKVSVVPEIADSAIQTATTGSRCFTAVVSSIVAALIVMGIGGLSLKHGTLAWKFLGLFILAIASAVLVAIVPGVNTFTKPSIKMILLALAAKEMVFLTSCNTPTNQNNQTNASLLYPWMATFTSFHL
jgi:hypothetical protein